MGPTSSSSSGGPMEQAALQQNLSRAFLQSAVAQNMQIQQQLMAQNQALQQLLATVKKRFNSTFLDFLVLVLQNLPFLFSFGFPTCPPPFGRML